MKSPLGLTPLPVQRMHEDSELLMMERDGFVDEAVVAALRAKQPGRRTAYPEDLALCADDLDFAGWQTSEAWQPRLPEVPPQVISAIVRRASPPVAGEPCIVEQHQGTHRWWLAGLAGVLSTLLVVALLLFLTSRAGTGWKMMLSPHAPAPVAKPQAELTAASSRQP